MKPSDSAVPSPARRLSVPCTVSHCTAIPQALTRLCELSFSSSSSSSLCLIWSPHPPSVARWFQTPVPDFYFAKPRFGPSRGSAFPNFRFSCLSAQIQVNPPIQIHKPWKKQSPLPPLRSRRPMVRGPIVPSSGCPVVPWSVFPSSSAPVVL